MFLEANGHLINTDELLAVLPIDDPLPALKSTKTQYRFVFKCDKELRIWIESDEYNKLKQILLEGDK